LVDVIKLEIESCEQEATIFRGNSLASKMFTTYARLIGSEYLFDTLAKFVLQIELLDKRQEIKEREAREHGETQELSLLDFDLELDSTKLNQEDLSMIEANQYNLELVSSKIFQSILDSEGNIPKDFKVVFGTVRKDMNDKFGKNDPNSVYYAVGGLLFLRFIIPSIFAPHVYGLLVEAPPQVTQRKLVLISKVIQSIANLSTPGKKEEHMRFMESFILKNIERVKKFYDDILQDIPEAAKERVREIPHNVRANAGAIIYQLFAFKINKLESIFNDQMDEEEAKPYIHEIHKIAEKYGEPPKKRVAKSKSKKTKRHRED